VDLNSQGIEKTRNIIIDAIKDWNIIIDAIKDFSTTTALL